MSTTRPDLSDFTADTSDFTPDAAPAAPSEPPKEGFVSSLGSDLFGMVKGLPSAAISASPLSAIREALPANWQQKIGFQPSLENIKAMAAADAARKQAGYGAAYRAIAPLGELAGANVGGMEQAAAAGDPGAVLGHAAAVPTAMALTAGVGKLAGKYVGIRSRATQGFQNVESKIGDAGVNHQPVLNQAYKAMEMSAKGFSLPKPVADFVEWAKSVQASQTPFRFADARDFYTALGESIPWDQYGGKGGRMWNQVEKMRAQLGTALQDTANKSGMGTQYSKALQDYRTASQLTKSAKTAGSAVTLGMLGKSMGLSGGDILAGAARKMVNAGGPGTIPGPETVAPPPRPGMSDLEMDQILRRPPEGTADAVKQALQNLPERRGMRQIHPELMRDIPPPAPEPSAGVTASDPRFANTQAGTVMGAGGDPLTQQAMQQALAQTGGKYISGEGGTGDIAQQILNQLKRGNR